ncbi:hypothetical protein [uncultured Methanobrevibacter sp.]|uniref:hypothetical protein n=1 Tax=uncultured Methanobrevibacter sp. TaxID=253161 RepID=UPI0025EB07C0|nr:hypothetical protein [uncultured Methanobrevibacter sp.]
MKVKDLFQERVIPALDKMYKQAANIFSCESLGYYEIDRVIKYIKQNIDKDYDARFILYCFYLENDEQKKILNEATKYLKYYWRWPYKSQILYSDSQIKEMKNHLAELKEKVGEDDFEYRDLKEKIDNNNRYKKQDKLWKEYYKKLTDLSEQLEKKEITKKEYNKKEAELAKSYGCTKRSRDAEAVYFEIWNYAPTISKEIYEKYLKYWNHICQLKKLRGDINIDEIVESLYNIENSENKNNELETIKDYMKNANTFIVNYLNIYDTE